MAALGTGFGQSTVQFSTNIYNVAENAGSVILTVQRTVDTNTELSVDYATANSAAIAGSDYTATNGTLNFAAGKTNQTIAVPILNDGLAEPSAYETFTVSLSNPHQRCPGHAHDRLRPHHGQRQGTAVGVCQLLGPRR